MTLLVDDRELLEAYRRGDRAAFAKIYDHYVDAVRRYLTLGFTFTAGGKTCRYQGTRNPMLSDDLIQETFIRGFSETARNGYDGLRPFKNYLLTIARNTVINQVQKEQRIVVTDEVPEMNNETAPPTTADQLVIDKELIGLTNSFVETLSVYDQKFFGLRYREQLSQQQTAKRLRITRAKVKTIEKRVRQKFVSFMRNSGYFRDRRGPLAAVATASCLWGGL